MAATRKDGIGGGFRSPVFDAQRVFDGVMRAFSRPGTIVDYGERLDGPPEMEPAAAALVATLVDYDTPVWLDEALGGVDPVRAWIGFETGAVIVGEPERARFALLSKGAGLPPLSRFAVGSAEYPDRSTTLILALAHLDGGVPLELTGPGIETAARFSPRGLPSGFLADWAINHAMFPRGIDVVFVAGSRAVALPRTTRIGGF